MSVAHSLIPRGIAVLLSPKLQHEIMSASLAAEQRITDRERAAEQAAQALQWIDSELDIHVTRCSQCVRRECAGLRSLRRQRARASGRYQRAIKRLKGGR